MVRIAGGRQTHHRRRDAAGAEAEIDLLKTDEALDEQRRAREQYGRQCQLADHKEAAGDPLVPRAAAARTVLQRRDHVTPRIEDGGQGTEEKSREHGNAEREEQHGGVQLDGVRARQHRRKLGAEDRQGPAREENSDRAAGDREQHRLGQHFADNPAAAGAKREPDGLFATPERRPRQRQVRDVRAGDQQDQPDGGEQHEESSPGRLRHDPVVDRRRRDTPVRIVFRVLFPELQRDGVHLLLRLLDRHAVSQPADHGHHVIRAVLPREVGRERGHDVDRQQEVTIAHDPDDVVGDAIEHDRLAQHRIAPAEAGFPDRLRDQRDPRAACAILVLGESAAGDRLHAEHREDVRRHLEAGKPLGFAPGRHRDAAAAPPAELGERLRTLGPRHVIRNRHGEARNAQLVVLLPYPHQPIGVLVGQRLERDGVNDAIDGGVGADAERQRGNGDEGEHRRAPQGPRRLFQIVKKHSHVFSGRSHERVCGDAGPELRGAAPSAHRGVDARLPVCRRHVVAEPVAKLGRVEPQHDAEQPVSQAHVS
jgi:hypothetical protein